MSKKLTLYTIGHSNRSFLEFFEILQAHSITYVVDVRTIPRSRHFPWFNQNSLKNSLKKKNILYAHMPELGGLRHPIKESVNLGWKNSSFRGYADYMQTKEFYLALKALNQLIKKEDKVTIMCAEALPWKCHRSLIADAEIIRGINVLNIFSKTSIKQHQLTAFAVVNQRKRPIQIYYPKLDEKSTQLKFSF